MVAPDRDRLRRAFRLKEAAAAPAEAAAVPARPEVRAFLQARLRQLAPRRPEVALPEGQDLALGGATCWQRLLRYGLDHVHGRTELRRVLSVDPALVAQRAKQPALADLRLDQCLFLDTETTGLSGGAGTVVFQVGMGFLEGDQLVVEQLLLRHFDEEPALLAQVAERLRQRPLLVTYVGKSFDRHRIAARMALHRVGSDVLTERHLDLYHLSRRHWARQLPDCRLRTVEEQVLGLHRDHDLPGSEAPRAFLDWVRDRSGPLDRVLEHNRLDVLSVVALLGVLGCPDR
ncbi:MAG: hypothetical protein RL148_1492 [Planctomycetota bacterium]|jgi:uncharacterized protein YprB with RNaseH-like and TPR domain